MPFNFYAETSFTEMGGHGSTELPSESTAVQRQLSADGRYPVLRAAIYSVLSWIGLQTLQC